MRGSRRNGAERVKSKILVMGNIYVFPLSSLQNFLIDHPFPKSRDFMLPDIDRALYFSRLAVLSVPEIEIRKC